MQSVIPKNVVTVYWKNAVNSKNPDPRQAHYPKNYSFKTFRPR